VAVTPGGTRVLVANRSDNTVSVINTATNTVIATIPVGSLPSEVAVTPGGTRAYVTNEGSGNVSVINVAGNSVITTIPVGTQPFGVAVTLGGTRAYVANFASNTVSVIDTATKKPPWARVAVRSRWPSPTFRDPPLIAMNAARPPERAYAHR